MELQFLISFIAQVTEQILCYLKKFKTTIPAIAVPLDEQLMKDMESEQYNINHFNSRGIHNNLVDAHNLLTIASAMLKIFDQKHVALCEDIMAKVKPVIENYSDKGAFKDVFLLNMYIRNRLNETFGGDCGKSTLPDGPCVLGNLNI